MFESFVPDKFPELRCATCGRHIPPGVKCVVKTDMCGWLLYAHCLICPKPGPELEIRIEEKPND